MIDKVYIIECRTGCSCCDYENHYRGPYKTKEEAEKRIKYFRTGDYCPVASQYSRRGSYSIEEMSVEPITHGRYIINGRIVIHGLEFIDLNDDGSLDDEAYGGIKDDYPLEVFDHD